MKLPTCPAVILGVLALFSAAAAQTATSASPATAAIAQVPPVIQFSNIATDERDTPLSGPVEITFSLYNNALAGEPLWSETQKLTLDNSGHYSAYVGITKPTGVPTSLFTSGQAHWLGVRIAGQPEQPRVFLVSVPYAMKAGDAATIGGLPPSAFVLAAPTNPAAESAPTAASDSAPSLPPTNGPITGLGTTAAIPLWDSTSDIISSAMTQTGSGSTARIGINVAAPAATLDVKGTSNFRGTLGLPSAGLATATAGTSSYPLVLTASAFNSGTAKSVLQNFRWQAEPAGNDTATPSGTLNLLYGSGTTTPAETGLRIASNGQLTFAKSQSFPGTGKVSSVALSAPSADFTVSGSPITGSGTLALQWTVPPATVATPNAIVKRDSGGGVTSTAIYTGYINAFGDLDYAINASTSSTDPSAVGVQAITPAGIGVYAQGATGIRGYGTTYGVFGIAGASGTAVYGTAGSGGLGVLGDSTGSGSIGVEGIGYGYAVGVEALSTNSAGIYAQSDIGPGVEAYTTYNGTGVLAGSYAGYAAWFNGDVEVDGTLTGGSSGVKIDHPLDPANKYLSQSFVESPDMMSIYNGNVTTDGQGNAVVALPDWFETLNRDFRYQLTVLGQFAQAIVASKVANHQFTIKTDKPGVEVSWQVTGIRQDAWANAHRTPVEEVKPELERGAYLHPELYGAPEEKSVLWARSPQEMKRWKEARLRAAQKIKIAAPPKFSPPQMHQPHAPTEPQPEATISQPF